MRTEEKRATAWMIGGLAGFLLVIGPACDPERSTPVEPDLASGNSAELRLRFVYEGNDTGNQPAMGKRLGFPDPGDAYWETRDSDAWSAWPAYVQQSMGFDSGPEVDQTLTVQGDQAKGALRVQAGEKFLLVGCFEKGLLKYTGTGEVIARPEEANKATIVLSPWEEEAYAIDEVRVLVFHVQTPPEGKTLKRVARYCESAMMDFAAHADEFEIAIDIPCYNGAEFDASVGQYTAEDIDVIVVGGDNTFNTATAQTIENAVFRDGKILLVNFWSNRNFSAALPLNNLGDATYGPGLSVVDPNGSVFRGLPSNFPRQGSDYNREKTSPKEGAVVLATFDLDGSPALAYWQYGAGYVLEVPYELNTFYGEWAGEIMYRAFAEMLGDK